MGFWVINALWVSSVLLQKHGSMSMIIHASDWTFPSVSVGYGPTSGTATTQGTGILSYGK